MAHFSTEVKIFSCQPWPALNRFVTPLQAVEGYGAGIVIGGSTLVVVCSAKAVFSSSLAGA